MFLILLIFSLLEVLLIGIELHVENGGFRFEFVLARGKVGVVGSGLEERGEGVEEEEDDYDVVEVEPSLLLLAILLVASELVPVDVAATLLAVHGHSLEECAKEVIELFELVVLLCVLLPLLGTRTIFLWAESIVMCLFLRID